MGRRAAKSDASEDRLALGRCRGAHPRALGPLRPVGHALPTWFEGHVYCTPATAEILPRLAKSSARLQRTKLAEFHAGVKTGLPEDADEPPVLFSEREAQLLAERLRPIPYGLTEQLTEDVMLRFEPAGHIVGAGWCIWSAVPGRKVPAWSFR